MQDISKYNFSGKKVLIRVDFNIPLDKDLRVVSVARIEAVISTIKQVLIKNGSVILMSHLGRPKNLYKDKFSLKNILSLLSHLLEIEVKFAKSCIGEETKKIVNNLKMGEVLLLENLRFFEEETSGDREFAKKLADLGDVFIFDAFGTAHRKHASTAIIAEFFPKEKKMFGFLIAKELQNIDAIINHSKYPFTAIVGGSKVSTKINVIEAMLDSKVNNLIIGGGMAYTFIKAMGGKIGSSLVEDDKIEVASAIIKKAKEKNIKLYLPIDSLNADKFENNANTYISDINDIKDEWMGLDIGQKSIDLFSDVIKNSKTILWNGPMGVFEMPKYEEGTKQIALSIAEATKKGAFSLIGGGDSIAAVNKFKIVGKVSYVSTGGGALLRYIQGHNLPGIEAIKS